MSLPQVTSRFAPEHAKFNMEIGKIKSEDDLLLDIAVLGRQRSSYCKFRERIPISSEWIIQKQENKTNFGGLNITGHRFPHG